MRTLLHSDLRIGLVAQYKLHSELTEKQQMDLTVKWPFWGERIVITQLKNSHFFWKRASFVATDGGSNMERYDALDQLWFIGDLDDDKPLEDWIRGYRNGT